MGKHPDQGRQSSGMGANSKRSGMGGETAVTLLTGGGDRPYVFGLTLELISNEAAVDLSGSDYVHLSEFDGHAQVNFLKLARRTRPDVNFAKKVLRVSIYYARAGSLRCNGEADHLSHSVEQQV